MYRRTNYSLHQSCGTFFDDSRMTLRTACTVQGVLSACSIGAETIMGARNIQLVSRSQLGARPRVAPFALDRNQTRVVHGLSSHTHSLDQLFSFFIATFHCLCVFTCIRLSARSQGTCHDQQATQSRDRRTRVRRGVAWLASRVWSIGQYAGASRRQTNRRRNAFAYRDVWARRSIGAGIRSLIQADASHSHTHQ